MTDLFEEIDEELRREKLEQFWKKNGNTIITVLILVVLATAAVSAYTSWRSGHSIEQTEALLAAGRAPNPQSALETFASDAPTDHKAIALLSAAGIAANDHNYKDAFKLLMPVVSDSSVDPYLRDYARVLSVGYAIDGLENPEKLLSNLEPVMDDDDNPWYALAHIYSAVLHAKNSDYKTAINLLDSVISNTAIMAGPRETAQSLKSVYQTKQSLQKAEGHQDDKKINSKEG